MNNRYSYSMLRTYLTCPYAYKKCYVDGDRRESKYFKAKRGKRIHEFLNVVLNAEKPDIVSETDVLHYTTAVELCSHLKGGWTAVYTEFRIECEIAGRNFVAVPDAVVLFKDGSVSVVEFKSGGLPANVMQAAVYALAVKKHFGRVDTLHYVTPNGTKTVCVTGDLLGAYEAAIASIIDKLEHDGEFKPKPSAFCEACEYKDCCPFAANGKIREYLEARERMKELQNEVREQLNGKMFEYDGEIIEYKNGVFSVVGERDDLWSMAIDGV